MTGKILEKYSLGVGDRFAHQARPQLAACMLAAREGTTIVPVWNKSNREHKIVGSEPSGTRAAADAAVREMDWKCSYYLDADHINLGTVDRFLAPCDFFTLDVADTIGRARRRGSRRRVSRRATRNCSARIEIAGIAGAARSHPGPGSGRGRQVPGRRQPTPRASTATSPAAKGPASFVTEVSMDETDSPQTPPELLLILAAIADAGIPIQTIAPKFTGRFNKGVDYVGDLEQFEQEFVADLAVIAHAVRQYGLPANLKLSVHSGSDKFSIYAPIRRALRQTRRRHPLEDRGNHLAGGVDRPGRSRRRRSGDRQGDLRLRLRALRRIVRPLCRGDRHRCQPPAGARRSFRLDLGAVRFRACVTTSAIRSSIRMSGSCCMWATRWRPRWASAIPTCSKPARSPFPAM